MKIFISSDRHESYFTASAWTKLFSLKTVLKFSLHFHRSVGNNISHVSLSTFLQHQNIRTVLRMSNSLVKEVIYKTSCARRLRAQKVSSAHGPRESPSGRARAAKQQTRGGRSPPPTPRAHAAPDASRSGLLERETTRTRLRLCLSICPSSLIRHSGKETLADYTHIRNKNIFFQKINNCCAYRARRAG